MSILSLSDLAKHPTRTKEHEITISLLTDYYETYLNQHFYDFQLNNGVTIRIDFHKENFCHIVGIDQIASSKFKNPNDSRLFMYRGKQGFRRSKSGKNEFKHLRALHQHELKKQQDKMFFFHFIHTMLDSVNLTLVSYTIIPGSTIRCDFMFHDKYDSALLHLGVEKNLKTGNFFPKTFFVRYLTQTDVDRYIKPQTPVTVTGIKKVPR
ncbi:PBECR4 domain-containing protein [Bacillus toyonensis]|uniref:PBECR4 domain-containing protein n=1 Tax=Bacillus toyonensis TaxID=155322 RepID=UPI000BFD4AFE|nr:PBECR4 domain-containing protein [Bacillus toyonensis]PHE23614.1 hypothetical protein COF73_29255 [Bacillus toyonensis]